MWHGPRNEHDTVFVDAEVVDSAGDWKVGDWFTLRYVNHDRFRHRFWTSHPGSPDSQLVTVQSQRIPLEDRFRVESLATAYYVPHQCWYIAAKTQHGVWTNIQAGTAMWAVPCSEPPSPAPANGDSTSASGA